MARRFLVVSALAAASVLALAGCAAPATGGADDGRIEIVASTDVYAQIVDELAGDLVEVTAIVSGSNQDPHSFEPSARDQLAVSRADLIIENGGGYDAFVDALIEASGSEAPVLTAVEFSPAWPGDEHADEGDEHADEGDEHGHDHIEGFNEHVWYDPATMGAFAQAIADELETLIPDAAADLTANLDAFTAEIEGLEDSLADIAAEHAGAKVFLTEPVPGYLVEAAGLVNVTPDAFSEAVEEGQDVAPATLLESLALIDSGDVRIVLTNTQTGGAETTEIAEEAQGRDIPVLAFSETLPEDETYLSWMQANIEALAGALAA
ncbi:zinc ABC transporter substrate-binding protein [Microbacterium sp. BWT-B31]|uniref:metal ABC transporter solute-binding protein, Zn/Mn family n=1 Tax=Microbacterium sp. BWT-B31 TaxID=3232072 RepID=UPI0035288B0A